MIKVQNSIATREPMPDFLVGLAPESLADLSWTDPALGVQNCAWFPEVDETPAYNSETHQAGDETLVVDLENKVVKVIRAVLPLPAEVIAARAAEREAALIKEYDGIVQSHLDAVARSFGYGDPNRPEVSPILHAISYAEEPTVERFMNEGRALRAWRSLVWVAAAGILNAVKAGDRAVPTEAELLAELPDPPTQDPL